MAQKNKQTARQKKTFREAKQWGLPSRTRGIGSGDASTILGVNPWSSPYKLWCEKTGRVERSTFDEAKAYWGRVLEPLIARHYMSVTGRKLIDRAPTPDPGKSRFDMRVHPDYDWMVANLDYEIAHTTDTTSSKEEFIDAPFEGAGVYEGKNTSQYMEKSWSEEIPLHVYIQTQHEMACADLNWGSVAVLIGGNTFAWRDLPRDDEFVSLMIEREHEFWEMCMNDNPPPIDGTESTNDVLKKLYPDTDGQTLQLDDLTTAVVQHWLQIKSELKEANAVLTEIQKRKMAEENKIMAAIGNATFGVLSDGSKSKVEWKKITRGEYSVKEKSYRNLYFKKAVK